jgi:cobalt-zinc-cadmium efflux system outer membrane protein
LPPLSLPALEQMAIEQSPSLKQAEADIAASRGRARQAGAIPNPTIGFTAEEVSGGTILRRGEQGVFVEQTIPLGGKLRLSRETFDREADRAALLRDAQRSRVLNSVRIAFYAALAAQQRIEVRERLATLATEAEGVSSQLFNTGIADRPDVLSAEIESRENRLELTRARNAWQRAWLTLAATVGDPALPARPLAGALADQVPALERDASLQAILTKSPELAAAKAAVARAETALKRQRREPIPDLVLRGGPRYNHELLEETPAGDRTAVGWEAAFDIGITVPLFNRNQGNIATAQAEVTRAQQDVRRLELSLATQFGAAFQEYQDARQMTEIYRNEMIPRAEQSYQLYLTRYREMGAAYPQVQMAQRALFQLHDRYVSALESLWRAAIQIQGFLLAEDSSMPMAAGTAMPGTMGAGGNPEP